MSYEAYKLQITEDVQRCIQSKGCQPVVFVGSGLSRRLIGAPRWRDLLEYLANRCPNAASDFAYYEQRYDGKMSRIGSVIAESYFDWAWSSRERFPSGLFDGKRPRSIFLKHDAAEYLRSITPASIENIDTGRQAEVVALRRIRPHAVITTNYDTLLELIFPEYAPVIGQQLLHSVSGLFGEIYKIHGCVTAPESLVLTSEDYDDFMEKKKYLSAKLLTFFAEHPLLFIGYSAQDANVRAILSDIDEILAREGQQIPNIYLLRWSAEDPADVDLQREELIPVHGDRRVRIKAIVANDFQWVFEALSVTGAMERVNPKILRGLLARTYDLVRYDIPKRTLEVDYSVLERAAESEAELAKLFGITIVTDASHVNVSHPYLLSGVAEILGYVHWNHVHRLLESVTEKAGVNIKSFDNKYHVAFKSGRNAVVHKYSQQFVDLMRAVRDDEEWVLDLPEPAAIADDSRHSVGGEELLEKTRGDGIIRFERP